MTTDVSKELTLLGVNIQWTKNDPEDTTVSIQAGDACLNPDELRELISTLQQALNEVEPPEDFGRAFWPQLRDQVVKDKLERDLEATVAG